jgi:hypothetical protein
MHAGQVVSGCLPTIPRSSRGSQLTVRWRLDAAAPFASLLAERTPALARAPAPARLGRPRSQLPQAASCACVSVRPMDSCDMAAAQARWNWMDRETVRRITPLATRHSPPIQGHVPGVRACPVLSLHTQMAITEVPASGGVKTT